MNANVARTFHDKPAVREATPLLLGLIGPSGSGKTYSALRIATGIQRVSGGDIFGIDTESRRMLHYAERFKFRHLQFDAPFGSLDYLAAIEHCVKKGAKTLIVDSMSHEHEGPGGMLEQHTLETQRLAKLWRCSEEKAQISAWAGPKQDRRRMINSILQLNANFIFCFRAKEKMKLGGAKPEIMGFMPIAGEEFVYEMVLKCLLLPSANGTPTWQSEYSGERLMMKIPEQFKELFSKPKQLDEDTGQKLAEWAAGADKPASTQEARDLITQYQACTNAGDFKALEEGRAALWKVPAADKRAVSADDKRAIKSASDAAAARLADGPRPAASSFGPADAIRAIKESGDAATLLEAWNDVLAKFAAADTAVPADVESAYNQQVEALGAM